jgi:hypothetical protein
MPDFPPGNPWTPGFEVPPVPGVFCSVCADAVDAISTNAAILSSLLSFADDLTDLKELAG